MLNDVWEFQNTFGHNQSTSLSVLAFAQRELRLSLQQEELNEYKKAVREGNKLEILDGLIDGIYICIGSMLAHGFQNVDNYLFRNKEQGEINIDSIIFIGLGSYLYGHLSIGEIKNYYEGILNWHIDKIKEYEQKGFFTKDCLFDAFTEVHNSNMSKLENGKPIYREDGKILKGANFVKPDLSRFICSN